MAEVQAGRCNAKWSPNKPYLFRFMPFLPILPVSPSHIETQVRRVGSLVVLDGT